MRNITTLVSNNLKVLLQILIVLSAVIIAGRYAYRLFVGLNKRKRTHNADIIEAVHFYGKMLKSLAESNYYRRPNQTPLEFLMELKKVNYSKYKAVKVVTENFCLVKYGGRKLSDNLRLANNMSLAELGR